MNARTLLNLAVRDPRQAMAILREQEHRQEAKRKGEEHMEFANQLMKRIHDVRRKT